MLDPAKIDTQIYDQSEYTALGIGDLLISVLLIKLGLLKRIVIDLAAFDNTTYYPNPTNALAFRLNLLNRALRLNDVPFSAIHFSRKPHSSFNEHLEMIVKIPLESWRLKLDDPGCEYKDYIVIHTKCRYVHGFNYTMVRDYLKSLSKHCFRHRIILLGEKIMPKTSEAIHHGIGTIYEEAKSFKSLIEVLDLTKDNIYNNLDLDSYLKDISIIKNAKANIIFGSGGHTVSTMVSSMPSLRCFFGNLRNYVALHNSLNNTFFDDLQRFDTAVTSL